MKDEAFKVGEPMDEETFQRFLRSGQVPLRLAKTIATVAYDIKFHWRNRGNRFKASQFRIYFGKFFRESSFPIEAISIGPGTPYKTENIIVLLNPPATVEKRWDVKAFRRNETPGRKVNYTVGHIGGKSLVELFFESAAEVGINIRKPNKPSESVNIQCTLIPFGEIKESDTKCILQIDKIEYV